MESSSGTRRFAGTLDFEGPDEVALRALCNEEFISIFAQFSFANSATARVDDATTPAEDADEPVELAVRSAQLTYVEENEGWSGVYDDDRDPEDVELPIFNDDFELTIRSSEMEMSNLQPGDPGSLTKLWDVHGSLVFEKAVGFENDAQGEPVALPARGTAKLTVTF